jgi:hypothetical protein
MYWYTSAGPRGPLTQHPRSTQALPTHASARTTAPDGEPIREELVDRVRAEIAAGVYDTDERWEIALDHLFERLEAP